MLMFVMRLNSAYYVSLYGPVYSDNLKRMISNPDAGYFFSLALLCTLLPFALILRPARLRELAAKRTTVYSERLFSAASMALLGSAALYILALYVDLFRRGIIPVFSCMERYDYVPFAGPLHLPLFHYGPIALMLFGGMTVYRKIQGGRYDFRYIFLFLLVVIYALLTGHRFSAPVVFLAYFAMPFGVLFLSKTMFAHMVFVPKNGNDDFFRFWAHPVFLASSTFIIVLVLVGAALLNSYANVRSHGCTWAGKIISRDADLKLARARFKERVLIQPSELWIDALNRLLLEEGFDPERAIRFHFVHPGLAGGDVGIRYLMARSIGFEKEQLYYNHGQQFQGGYPSIFLELFGPLGGWPAMMLAGLLYAAVLL